MSLKVSPYTLYGKDRECSTKVLEGGQPFGWVRLYSGIFLINTLSRGSLVPRPYSQLSMFLMHVATYSLKRYRGDKLVPPGIFSMNIMYMHEATGYSRGVSKWEGGAD